jgi:alpha-L-fucosidase
MTQEQEVESLKLTNNIQQKVIKERGDQLVQAIRLLHKLVPVARDKSNKSPREQMIIEEAVTFLHDGR